jgi:hypothetical protein
MPELQALCGWQVTQLPAQATVVCNECGASLSVAALLLNFLVSGRERDPSLDADILRTKHRLQGLGDPTLKRRWIFSVLGLTVQGVCVWCVGIGQVCVQDYDDVVSCSEESASVVGCQASFAMGDEDEEDWNLVHANRRKAIHMQSPTRAMAPLTSPATRSFLR